MVFSWLMSAVLMNVDMYAICIQARPTCTWLAQVVVKPLPKSAFGDGDSSYIVLNRPYAFMEWSV
jgi:hypothetical protein